MENRIIQITILGAGISGLATAYWLKRDGYNVTVLEANEAPGGSMETLRKEGFLVDCGPNSGLETTPLIRRLVAETGLDDQMIYANETGGRRYILKRGRLYPLPMGPGAFLKTGLFSIRAKSRLIAEPFIGKSEDGYYQSIGEFVRRRLGREFLDYAIDPFVSGVYAGDPDNLSVKSAFPKLYRLEEMYGGLIKGMIKGAKERKARAEKSKDRAKMFTFINGMQSFPEAIVKKLGESVHTACEVETVSRSGNRWRVSYRAKEGQQGIDSDIVLSALPAYRAASVFRGLDEDLALHLNEMQYPAVKVLFLGYREGDVGRALDGFGFLIPKKEQKSFLGAIWSSALFPGRAPDGMAAFTLFIGGARASGIFDTDPDRLYRTVLSEFGDIMSIKADPIFVHERMWKKAIPQYNLGYIEHEHYFQRFERNHIGLFLGGNYRGGISVGDCIIRSDLLYEQVKETVERNAT